MYEVFGTDTEEYFRFYKKNYSYLYRDPENSFRMKVDTDLREIGVANYDIAMLDSAITIWERGGKEAAKGERLLKRYTLCNFATPQEYKNWVDTNRDNLFFSEAGGFLWLVNTNVPNAVGNDYTALILDLKATNEEEQKHMKQKNKAGHRSCNKPRQPCGSCLGNPDRRQRRKGDGYHHDHTPRIPRICHCRRKGCVHKDNP